MYLLLSLEPFSKSLRREGEKKNKREANTRDRSALAVEINAVIYYGKVETYAIACTRAGVSVCVCAGERGRQERDARGEVCAR